MKKLSIRQAASNYMSAAGNAMYLMMSSLTKNSRHPYKLRVRIYGTNIRKYVLLDKECYEGIKSVGITDDEIVLRSPQGDVRGTNYMIYAIGDRVINPLEENTSILKFFIGPGYYRARQVCVNGRNRETLFIDVRREAFIPVKKPKAFGKPVFYL